MFRSARDRLVPRRCRHARRHDPLDEHQLSIRCDRAATVAQDGGAPVVVPVVDYALQRIGVSAGRNRVEEGACDELASLRQPHLRQLHPRPLDRVGHVEQHALDPGMRIEDCREQRPVSTADINDPAHTGEVVHTDDLVCDDAGHLDHRAMARASSAKSRAPLASRSAMRSSTATLTAWDIVAPVTSSVSFASPPCRRTRSPARGAEGSTAGTDDRSIYPRRHAAHTRCGGDGETGSARPAALGTCRSRGRFEARRGRRSS